MQQYTAEFIAACSMSTRLTPEAIADLQNSVNTLSVSKGQYLLKSGQTCRQLFFIHQGIAKTFFHNEAKEFIMKFFTERSMFTVVDSFKNQQPSMYAVIALEDTVYTAVSYQHLTELCSRHHCMETFFSRLLAEAAANMMLRITEMLEENPAERYAGFCQKNAALLQRITLGDLASYLGITQVSLSRIRVRK